MSIKRVAFWYAVWTLARAAWQSRELIAIGDAPSIVDALWYNVQHFAVRPLRLPQDG